MNREGAETYLRLLAEAEMRDPSAPLWPMPWSGGFPAGNTCRTLQLVAQALTAVDALDARTVAAILADFDLAVTARQQRGPGSPARGSAAWPASGISGAALQAVTARIRARGVAPGMAGPFPPPPAARRGPPTATLTRSAAAGRPAPGPEQPAGDRPFVPERFVPVGVTVPFRHEMTSGRLYLMAYARSAGGTRLTAVWQPHSPASLGVPDVGLCTVTDDRGRRYRLDFTLGTSIGPRWTGMMTLNPGPPGDPRWLDICPPGGTAVRVGLDAAGAAGDGAATARVSQVRLGPGEHLLTLIAERLLAEAQDLPRRRRQEMPPSGPLSTMAAGLGEVVAALEAAEALAPDSPLPGRLATLCANLSIDVPGLAAPPAYDLPEPWLSALAHYHRRKPDTGPPGEEVAAALAAALPELDGIRLALLGLTNALGHSWLHVLASGLTGESRHGHSGLDTGFPLSVWILDSGGRWHLARPAGRARARAGDGEELLRLRLTPELSRSATWIEALVAGRSAQARVRLPLRWDTGYE